MLFLRIVYIYNVMIYKKLGIKLEQEFQNSEARLQTECFRQKIGLIYLPIYVFLAPSHNRPFSKIAAWKACGHDIFLTVE